MPVWRSLMQDLQARHLFPVALKLRVGQRQHWNTRHRNTYPDRQILTYIEGIQSTQAAPLQYFKACVENPITSTIKWSNCSLLKQRWRDHNSQRARQQSTCCSKSRLCCTPIPMHGLLRVLCHSLYTRGGFGDSSAVMVWLEALPSTNLPWGCKTELTAWITPFVAMMSLSATGSLLTCMTWFFCSGGENKVKKQKMRNFCHQCFPIL